MRKNIVLTIACVAAVLTCFIVPPDDAYLGYVDVKTIACLFSILAVVGAMRNLGMFQYAARKIIHGFHNCRAAVCALVGVTLLVSMVATNDMALIMMLPLSAATLLAAGWGRALPFTFIMQNLAANLGGMILPFGNPQNLYLFEYFHLGLGEFLEAMAVPFVASVAMIAVCCLSGLDTQPSPHEDRENRPHGNFRIRSKREATPHHFIHFDDRAKRRLSAVVYLALMLLVILAVFRLVPYMVSVAVVVAVLAFMDRKAVQTLDYGLLLTFVFFFIFAGNMARIPAVDQLLSTLMTQWPLAVSAGLSQVISNVPAAVLLSHFTQAWADLLVGVNIGGAGTIVGSLASLITLQHYRSIRRETDAAFEAAQVGEGKRAGTPAVIADRVPKASDKPQASEAPDAARAATAAEPAASRVVQDVPLEKLPRTASFIYDMTVYNVAFLLVLFVICSIV